MITGALFTGYAFGVGAIIYNITQIKLQNDFENDIRKLREYDYSHEEIVVETHLKTPNDAIILLKYNPEQNQHLKVVSQKIQQSLPGEGSTEEKKPELFFSKVVSYSNLLDPTKYIEVRNQYLLTLIIAQIWQERWFHNEI